MRLPRKASRMRKVGEMVEAPEAKMGLYRRRPTVRTWHEITA
jgi:hypothetical protein